MFDQLLILLSILESVRSIPWIPSLEIPVSICSDCNTESKDIQDEEDDNEKSNP